jgi:hypothetical protein
VGVSTFAALERRTMKLSAAQARRDALLRLAQEMGAERFSGSPSSSAEHSVQDQVERLLETAITLFATNPHSRIIDLMLGRQATTVSLWYLEPEPSPSKHFRVRCYASSAVDPHVKHVYEWLKETYRPVHFDRRRFDRVARACQAARGRDWEDLFLAQQERHEYVSLAGYVFAKKTSVAFDKLDRCLAFSRDIFGNLGGENARGSEIKALDFQSAIACPVFRQGAGQHAVAGTLVAFRPIVNGFLPEDERTLDLTSGLLGRLLDHCENQSHFGGQVDDCSGVA